MVLGNMKISALKDVLYFKETISILLISILFILLSANINLSDLELIYNWNSLILFGCVVLIVRPLGVFLSSRKSSLGRNEKIFISWVGPRGIVAAGIASLFGSKLLKAGVEGAEYITPLVFMIVLGTVLLNATTARLFAKIAGVFFKSSDGILIIGASSFSRLIASYLKNNNRRVVLIDSNAKSIEKAKDLGLEAIEGNIYSDELTENIELNDVGFLLSLTASATINKYAIENNYDLYLLTYIDTPWEADDLRDKPKQREQMFTQFKNALITHQKNYIVLKGDKATRLKKAISHIDQLINKNNNNN